MKKICIVLRKTLKLFLWMGIAFSIWGNFSILANAYTPRYTAPSASNAYYYSSKNPFYASGYGMPNCTAYAYGRAYEILGYKPNLSTGNAGAWWNYNISNRAFAYGNTPRVGAIVCWDYYDNNTGHVAVVEKVENGTVTVSQSNWGGINFQVCTYSVDNPIIMYDVNSGNKCYAPSHFQGYIYLINDTEKPVISNVRITDLTSDGYTVKCDVTDNEGVARVSFPTWTLANGQDDLSNDWYNVCAVYTPTSGNTYTFRVNIKNHNNETGAYATHIYAYDAAGNYVSTEALATITVPLTSFTLNSTEISLTRGETKTLSVTAYTPSNTTSNKTATWGSENAAIATVDSSGKITAKGVGTTNIVCTVAGVKQKCRVTVKDPTYVDGWYYVSTLPSDITTSTYEIQYQHTYQTYAVSSPGNGWTDTGVDKKEYVKSGSTYESTLPLTTSDTVKLENYYYYHFCGASTGINANFAQTSTYGHYDEIRSVASVSESASYTDVDDSRYTYYRLKWKDGTDAYCNTSKGTCDGTHGNHGNRSYYWYKMYVYQNCTVKTLNLYQTKGQWSANKDNTAIAISCRYRMKPTGVSLNKSSVNLTAKGATATLTATISPSGAADRGVTWTSSNTSVATVSSSGVVTAVASGIATITATVADKSATCTVNVSIDTEKPVISNAQITEVSYTGFTIQCDATDNVGIANVCCPAWTTANWQDDLPSNWGNASCISGNTYAYRVDISEHNNESGEYTCYIIVHDTSGNYSSIEIKATVPANIPLTDFSLNATQITLKNGATQTLSVTGYTPTNTTSDKKATWGTENAAIAVVDASGKVTAKGVGTTNITCTIAGIKKTCKVAVEAAEVPTPTPGPLPFTDVPQGTWYHNYVANVYEKGYMVGSGTAFKPAGLLTRAEIVTTLYSMSGKPATEQVSNFTDVPGGQWYSTPISWAYRNNIASGYANGKFGTTDLITREQFAVMLYQYASTYGFSTATNDSVLNGYSDAGAVSTWANTAMKWAVTNEIISGKTATTLDPKGSATRAECATMITKLEQLK